MRHLVLLAAACFAASTGVAPARPLDVHVHGGQRFMVQPHARLASYLVRHGLLTPEQAACASLVTGPLGSRRVEHVLVYQNTGGRCPGVPQPPTYLFDAFVDRVSGVVDTTRDDRDELKTVL